MAKLKLSKEEILEYAWLGLTQKDLDGEYVNQLIPSTEFDRNNPHIHLLKVLRRPENLAFTCKTIFNIELMPFQLAVMREFFTRPFPLVIGSRGSSKTFMLSLYLMVKAFLYQGVKIVAVGSGFRQSRILFDYCQRIWDGAPILRDILSSQNNSQKKQQGPHAHIDKVEVIIGDSQILGLPIGDGCLCGQSTLISTGSGISLLASQPTPTTIWAAGAFRQTDRFFQNGVKPAYKLDTDKGYSITATNNHQFRIVNKLDQSIGWKELQDICEDDYIPIDRTERWHTDSNNVTVAQAYSYGLMCGDGCWTQPNRLGFATKDLEFIDKLNEGTGLIFKQAADKVHFWHEGSADRQAWMDFWGIEKCYTINKIIPDKILSANKEAVAACISGLFDTDGTVQVINDKRGGTGVVVSFTNTSEKLVNQLQYLLLHFGIITTKRSRNRNEKWNTVFELYIFGQNVKLFAERIKFGLQRKQTKLLSGLAQKVKDITNGDEIPCARELMIEIVQQYRFNSKNGSEQLCVSKLRKRKTVGRELVELFLNKYGHLNDDRISRIRALANPNIYYDKVKSIEYAGEIETYDLHVPDGHEYCANGFFVHNSGIRGLRANILVADEFQSNQREVFETVVSGFAAVSLNPVEKVKYYAKLMKMKEMGIDIDEEDAMAHMASNQTILAGTATYQFNHMYDYWLQYHKIIESQGNINALMDIFKGEVPAGFNWKHFSIVRLPVELLPAQYVDQATIAKSKLTMMSGIFEMEFGSIFYADSPGFFKRSLIESCTTKEPIHLHTGPVQFSPRLKGDSNCKYVFGIDPASEQDNFSIVVLECWPDHRRVVYCWTINKSKYREKIEKHLIAEKDYYAYCARKIRDLMKVFPCERIAMDSQGGGYAICEALHEESKLENGERPLWQIIDDKKPKDEDDYPGLHIIQLCQFRDNMWTSTANHNLKKDFVDKTLLFPHADPLMMERYALEDIKNQKIYDGFEDCAAEIEEMKDEIASIVISITPTGNERWDTPDIKMPNGKKGKARKDRYSAILMANAGARALHPVYEMGEYTTVGGFAYKIAQDKSNRENGGEMYVGPDWFVRGASKEAPGAVVTRKGV